jgi:hypothetical protein
MMIVQTILIFQNIYISNNTFWKIIQIVTKNLYKKVKMHLRNESQSK